MEVNETELSSAQAEIKRLRAELSELKAKETVSFRAAEMGFHDPQDVFPLVRRHLDIRENGLAAGKDGRGLDSILNELKARRPEYVKQVPSAVSNGAALPTPAPFAANDLSDEQLHLLFGAKSDARRANKLALENPGKYQKLKAEAVRRRIL